MSADVPRALRWGLVGCGWVARAYVAPAIAASANGELVAACDPDVAALQALCDRHDGCAPYGDLDTFLAAQDLDAVYVAVPNHLHAPVVCAAADAGRHVLCEKPMALTVTDAEAMVERCAAAGVTYGTAFDQRFHAAHRRLRDLVVSGALGVVTAVRVTYACWTPPDWAPQLDGPLAASADNWRADPARAGGGALVDLAPHGLDLAQYLLGEQLVEVACLRQRRVFDYPVEDGAVVIATSDNGVLVTQHVAYNTPDTFPRRRLEVVGTEAMVIATNTMGQTPGGTLELVHARDGRRAPVTVDPAEDRSPFRNQVEAFAAAVLDARPFDFPPQRDLHTMRLLDAAAGSAGTLVAP